MTIYQTDKIAFDIMRSWYLHPPIEAEGFVEAITALCDQDHDALETNFFLASLTDEEDARTVLLNLIKERRLEEVDQKIRNIIFHNHMKLLESTDFYMKGVDRFLTLQERPLEIYSEPDTLKIYFGEEWRKYYSPVKQVI